jgi:hypothetical protein
MMGFFRDRVSLFAQAGFVNPDPPDLCLLNSYDYRREPPALDLISLSFYSAFTSGSSTLSPHFKAVSHLSTLLLQ